MSIRLRNRKERAKIQIGITLVLATACLLYTSFVREGGLRGLRQENDLLSTQFSRRSLAGENASCGEFSLEEIAMVGSK